MLAANAPADSARYAAEVAFYLHDNISDTDSVTASYGVAKNYLDLLRSLSPADPDDRVVLSYLADVAFCPESVPSLHAQATGWGLVLSGQQAVVIVNSLNQPVGSLSPGTLVQISCTSYAGAITGPFGTSTLWDFVGTGYVPDPYLYTGTNLPVAPNC